MKSNVLCREKSTKGMNYNQAEGGRGEGERKKILLSERKRDVFKGIIRNTVSSSEHIS